MPAKKQTKATTKVKPKKSKKTAGDDVPPPADLPARSPSPVRPAEDDDPQDQVDEPTENVPEQAGGREGDSDPDDPNQAVYSDHEEDEDAGTTTKGKAYPTAIEQQMAEFFEENPLFYDKSRSDFKNGKKKDRLLQDLSKLVQISGKFDFTAFLPHFYDMLSFFFAETVISLSGAFLLCSCL